MPRPISLTRWGPVANSLRKFFRYKTLLSHSENSGNDRVNESFITRLIVLMGCLFSIPGV